MDSFLVVTCRAFKVLFGRYKTDFCPYGLFQLEAFHRFTLFGAEDDGTRSCGTEFRADAVVRLTQFDFFGFDSPESHHHIFPHTENFILRLVFRFVIRTEELLGGFFFIAVTVCTFVHKDHAFQPVHQIYKLF